MTSTFLPFLPDLNWHCIVRPQTSRWPDLFLGFLGLKADSSGQGNLDSFPTSQPAAVPGEVTQKANPVEPAIERSALHVSEPVNPDAGSPCRPSEPPRGKPMLTLYSFEADETSPLPTVASPAMENSEG